MTSPYVGPTLLFPDKKRLINTIDFRAKLLIIHLLKKENVLLKKLYTLIDFKTFHS